MSLSTPVFPCPFCRSPRVSLMQAKIGPALAFWVSCAACSGCGPMAGGPEMAIQLWNQAERITGHVVCATCHRLCAIHYGGARRPCKVERGLVCSDCESTPPIPEPPKPPAQAQVPLPAAPTFKGTGTKKATGFCEHDTLVSEPDGTVSVRRGPGCTCQKGGA